MCFLVGVLQCNIFNGLVATFLLSLATFANPEIGLPPRPARVIFV